MLNEDGEGALDELVKCLSRGDRGKVDTRATFRKHSIEDDLSQLGSHRRFASGLGAEKGLRVFEYYVRAVADNAAKDRTGYLTKAVRGKEPLVLRELVDPFLDVFYHAPGNPGHELLHFRIARDDCRILLDDIQGGDENFFNCPLKPLGHKGVIVQRPQDFGQQKLGWRVPRKLTRAWTACEKVNADLSYRARDPTDRCGVGRLSTAPLGDGIKCNDFCKQEFIVYQCPRITQAIKFV